MACNILDRISRKTGKVSLAATSMMVRRQRIRKDTCPRYSSEAHHQHKKAAKALLIIIPLLGIIFLFVQVFEYYEAYAHFGLTLNAGIYGSTFFMLTGFHGFHVAMGMTMLLIQWLRSVRGGHFTADDHFGFEASSWYWHFVDVVWVGLFLFVYIL